MEDGISAIILIITVLLISMFFFAYLIEELFLVFLLIAIVLISLLFYTCTLVITTKMDKYRVQKEWKKVEELEKIQKRFFE
jgi:hypothetical protein